MNVTKLTISLLSIGGFRERLKKELSNVMESHP
jgi:hypothetical protein